MKNLSLLLCLLLIVNQPLFAQLGYSSASLSMNRANGIVSPNQVVIEEYLNYHEHKIPLPQAEAELALSIDYLNLGEQKLAIQVGISSKQLIDYTAVPPINVCLVIDRSGSMEYNNKLEKVKAALLKFMKGLRPDDYVSIVTYESKASVLLAATKMREVMNMEGIIKSIQTSGSTNLHEGLIFGYQQVEKNYKPAYNNKVILLTDGIANMGVTDPETIVKESGNYNQKGIDVATIGVGNDLNYSLLQKIARKGRGDNHFVGESEEDIQKVFEDELESLLSSVAKQVNLTIELPQELKVKQVYGYMPQFAANQISIPLNNINSGLTQVVLIEVETQKKLSQAVKATLTYQSCSKQSMQSMVGTKKLKLNENTSHFTEVGKNYYIAQMAQTLKNMAEKVLANEPTEAFTLLSTTLAEVDQAFPNLRDQDLLRVKNILLREKTKLDQVMVTKKH